MCAQQKSSRGERLTVVVRERLDEGGAGPNPRTAKALLYAIDKTPCIGRQPFERTQRAKEQRHMIACPRYEPTREACTITATEFTRAQELHVGERDRSTPHEPREHLIAVADLRPCVERETCMRGLDERIDGRPRRDRDGLLTRDHRCAQTPQCRERMRR